MKWRVVLELVGPDGVHEVGGCATNAEMRRGFLRCWSISFKPNFRTATKHITPNEILVGPISIAPHHLIEGESTRYRYAVTCRRTINPVAEIMRDRCTPEHERTVAKMGSLPPGADDPGGVFDARRAADYESHGGHVRAAPQYPGAFVRGSPFSAQQR